MHAYTLASFGDLANLRVLNLSNNMLEGNIPGALSKCSRLHVRDASATVHMRHHANSEWDSAIIIVANYFHTHTYTYTLTHSLTHSQMVRVQHNRLSGAIPEALVQREFLELFVEDNPELTFHSYRVI